MGTIQTAFYSSAVIAKKDPPEGTKVCSIVMAMGPTAPTLTQNINLTLIDMTQVRSIFVQNPDPFLPLQIVAGVNLTPYTVRASGGAIIPVASTQGVFTIAAS